MNHSDKILNAARKAAWEHSEKQVEGYKTATECYVARLVKAEMSLRERMYAEGFFAGFLAAVDWFAAQAIEKGGQESDPGD